MAIRIRERGGPGIAGDLTWLIDEITAPGAQILILSGDAFGGNDHFHRSRQRPFRPPQSAIEHQADAAGRKEGELFHLVLKFEPRFVAIKRNGSRDVAYA